MDKIKEKIKKAIAIQKIAVDSEEDQSKRLYDLGWLHCLQNLEKDIQIIELEEEIRSLK